MAQLEDRLRALQQHEAATQCQGGPLCVLPGPMFGASLIQGSPQVSYFILDLRKDTLKLCCFVCFYDYNTK